PGSGASARFSGASTATAVTDATGVATAPTLTANGTTGSYAVSASASGAGTPASFALTNTTGSTTGQIGVWTSVTPSGMTMNPNATAAGADNNFGVQGAFADPANPGTVYATVTYQGLWKSTDYGVTWSKVNVTSGQSPMDNGRPNMRIAPDGSYMITTALYPINGVSNGAWKTTNGGQTWTRFNVGAVNGDDIGMFDIDPFDKN